MDFGICLLPCVPIRRAPDLVSELTSQLLFGESFRVLQSNGIFLRVGVAHDGYEGWMDSRQAEPLEAKEFHALTGQPAVLTRDLVATATEGEQAMSLLRGSTLPNFANGTFGFGNRHFGFQGHVCDHPRTANALVEQARLYLGAPYLWGGRSPFGIDCSGFVQVVYRAFGIALPRDSPQQRTVGQLIPRLAEARPGDLAFFSARLDGTSHVGLIVPGGILHASVRVREDDLDEQGIRPRGESAHSHQLREIRRVAEFS